MRFLKALLLGAMLVAGAAVSRAQQMEEATHVLMSVPVEDQLVDVFGQPLHLDPNALHTLAPITSIITDTDDEAEMQPFSVLMLQEQEQDQDSEQEMAAGEDDSELVTDSEDDTEALGEEVDNTMEIAAQQSDMPELSRISRISRRFSAPLRHRFRSSRQLMTERAVKQRKLLKTLLTMKKIKALDLKMKLMNRVLAMLDRPAALRSFAHPAMDQSIAWKLLSLYHKLDKKIMMLKVLHLVHLMHDSLHTGRTLAIGDTAVSPAWLQHHIISQILAHRRFIPAFLRFNPVEYENQQYAPMLWMLKLKVLRALKQSSAPSYSATPMMKNFLLKADRAIVNLGSGNEFKPLFYRSSTAPTVSANGARLTVPINVSPSTIRGAMEHMRSM